MNRAIKAARLRAGVELVVTQQRLVLAVAVLVDGLDLFPAEVRQALGCGMSGAKMPRQLQTSADTKTDPISR